MVGSIIIVIFMPREGWETIAVREEYHKQLKDRADKNRRSLAGELEKILLDFGIVTPILKE